MIELPLLAAEWRDLNDIKDEREPMLERFVAPGGAISYALKTVGTNADLVTISAKLPLVLQHLRQPRGEDVALLAGPAVSRLA
jgi:hypothetical protein